MKAKQLVIAGAAAAIIAAPFIQGSVSFAKDSPKITQSQIKKSMSETGVVKKVQKWMAKQSYIQSGGSYGEGEYKCFPYKGTTYRYLSKDIDTRKELMKYLLESVTPKHAEKFIKEKGIIEHKGKMAQVEADGGSLLQWDRAAAREISSSSKEKIYKLIVPVGETDELEVNHAHFTYQPKAGWKINQMEFSHDVDLHVPFNINPAFIFFNFLLVDSTQSDAQFIDKESFDTEAFKQGITKIEVRTMEEQSRSLDRVEFKVTFYAELAKEYKGSLKQGENTMYFLVENTGEMEYKIVSAGMDSQLQKHK
ncbi:DL-endopeptidase inhibitor IseA family protein [Bacillus salacetis]|uniref:DL-endopeptidase inhibitor IseA family protein n=1 Tax=Bacillus salacetis TaxID=2315464 RepID=UPI003B9E3AA8